MIQNDAKLLARLQEILHPQPDAVKFFLAWNEYCHYIDDLVDGDIERTPESILKMGAMAAAIYSSNFYHRYYTQLYPVVLMITNEYGDSVKWERSNEEWKHRQADTLRHCGNNMLMVIVGIVGGYDAMREVSEMIRTTSYTQHHTVEGVSV